MASETFDQWRARLLDAVAAYGHIACMSGLAMHAGNMKEADAERERAHNAMLEIAFNPPASVDPHVRAAVERRALDARNDRYREAKSIGMSDADARLHSDQVLDFFRRSHG